MLRKSKCPCASKRVATPFPRKAVVEDSTIDKNVVTSTEAIADVNAATKIASTNKERHKMNRYRYIAMMRTATKPTNLLEGFTRNERRPRARSL